MISPKPRFRKVIHGYELIHKIRVDANTVYDATIKNTAPHQFTYEIIDQDRVVVSQDVANTVAIAKQMIIGQLVALGAKFPVLTPQPIAISAPLSAPSPQAVAVTVNMAKSGVLTFTSAHPITTTIQTAPSALAGTLVITSSATAGYTFTPVTDYTGAATAVVKITDTVTSDIVLITVNFTVA